MKTFRQGLCLILAVMMMMSVFASIGASADIDSEKHILNRITVDNAAKGGYAEDEADGVVVPRMATTVDYPESYSSVEDGYITSIKHQGEYGTCWAHGAAASAEASLIKNNGYSINTNFSELHLSYYMYNSAYDALGMLNGDSTKIGSRYSRYYSFLDLGGSNSFTPFTLARWTGLVDEGKYPQFDYSKAHPNFTAHYTSAYLQDEVHLTEAYWVSPNDIEDMKYMITKYGAGTIAYYHDDYYFKEATGSYYYGGTSSPNHEVTVVGWNDNYSKSNFKSSPSKDGAWLVKNSWGTDWGNGGYFWLSYEDKSLCSDVASFYAFENADNYDNNYQYDGSSIYEYDSATSGSLHANVFTADSNEYLKAVSFWTAQKNVHYSVQVYKNLADATNPTNGTKALSEEITGSETYAGYHTIKLPSSVYLSAGEKYSVVVKLTAKNESETNFFVDRSDSSQQWIVFANTASRGQSFFKDASSSKWVDKGLSGINYRIKAFTDEENGVTNNDKETATDSDVYYVSDTDSNSWWYDLFDKVDSDKKEGFTKVEDISTLANGDKILIYGAGSNTVVMPYMLPGRNNVLSAYPVEEAYFESYMTWTVRIDNDIIYLETSDGKRMVSEDANTIRLDKTGSTLKFENGDTDGTFRLVATGTDRFLKYNESLGGYRFYKSADENTDLTIYKYNSYSSVIRTKVMDYGDVTGDGEVTMLDVVAVQRLIADIADDSIKSLKMLADVNGDDEVTMEDVVLMQRQIADLSVGDVKLGKSLTFIMK
ncbi:MAG: lectin like domain-containing protein [Clostridia bacterium]|nr:lectin like domain-containing protein [Clostridia bacterium]